MSEVHPKPDRGAIEVVGIAASAGGYTALWRLLSVLPAEFPVPIIVVQHLSPRGPTTLAELLKDRIPHLRVKWAEHGERMIPGTVYVGVPNFHVTARADYTIALTQTEKVNFSRPSADVLFESLAANFGQRAVAVVLTGKLFDGAAGAAKIKAAGGWVLAQDRSSAASFEMPEAAVRAGAVDFVLSLRMIAVMLTAIVTVPGAQDLFRRPPDLGS